jgi:hypothetical protein
MVASELRKLAFETYSSGATESVDLTTSTSGWQVAAIGGSKTTGDVLTITVLNFALSVAKSESLTPF